MVSSLRCPASDVTLHTSTPYSLAPVYSLPLGAQHPGVGVPAAVQNQTPMFSQGCPYGLEGQCQARFPVKGNLGSFGERGGNTPAFRRDKAGVLLHLIPHPEGWWLVPHSQSEEVQPTLTAHPLQDAASVNSPHFCSARRWVHSSGPTGCLLPYSNSQRPQFFQFFLSRNSIPVQSSPFWSVAGPSHLGQMHDACSNHSGVKDFAS